MASARVLVRQALFQTVEDLQRAMKAATSDTAAVDSEAKADPASASATARPTEQLPQARQPAPADTTSQRAAHKKIPQVSS